MGPACIICVQPSLWWLVVAAVLLLALFENSHNKPVGLPLVSWCLSRLPPLIHCSSLASSLPDPEARLFFNPAFTLQGRSNPINASISSAYPIKLPMSAREPSRPATAAPVEQRRPSSARNAASTPDDQPKEATAADTAAERRAKLDALRAAVHGLEAQAAQQQAAPVPGPAVPGTAAAPGFLPGRPTVPRLQLASLNKRQRPLHAPTWAGPVAVPAQQPAVVTHAVEGPKSSGRGMDPSYSKVLAAVDGALRMAGTSPVKSARSNGGADSSRIPRPPGSAR